MAIPLTSYSSYSFGSTAAASTPAELYGRVSKSLLTQHAGVQKLSAQLVSSQARLSGLGQLQSALASFQSLTQSLAGSGLQTGATASAPAVLSALTTASARPATHAVVVQQLAQAQVLTSKAQKTQDTALGAGGASTIRIETGTRTGNSFVAGATGAKTITLDAGNHTLQGIAAALKAADIDARIVKGATGFSLQVTGQSGGANSMRISVAGDATLQKLLNYAPGGVQTLSESKQAQDALLTIDGKPVASASNVVTGDIPGVALALAGQGATQVTVARDSAAIAANVGHVVASFNTLSDQLKTLQQGQLRADPALQQAQDQLSQLMGRHQDKLAGELG